MKAIDSVKNRYRFRGKSHRAISHSAILHSAAYQESRSSLIRNFESGSFGKIKNLATTKQKFVELCM